MKTMALSGVLVLASAGLALASAEAPVKPEASLPAPSAEQATVVVKTPAAPGAETVSMACDGAGDAALCAEAAAKN